ncbi:MAG: integrase arm-type DNA-binding domain-containing protein [Woeseiaceae bacterium]
MAKQVDKLTALKVKNIKKAGWYADGKGLYLQVSESGSKSWVYRYQVNGKEKRHGLGSLLGLSLVKARKAADYCRELRAQKIDPMEYKRKLAAEKLLEEAQGITFKECAIAFIDSHKAGWKNPKHETYWRNTLNTYAYPVIGDLSVQAIDTGLVMKVIEPIWFTKTETASRVRQRVENILDWAKARGYRSGENPALWRGHIERLLPKRSKVQKVKHFSAMPYIELPNYFRSLRKIDTLAAKALAFTILTASRTSEARGALKEEISEKEQVWNIPAERMKSGRPHRTPLSDECSKILEEAENYQKNSFVFPALKKEKSISDAALLKLLKTTHPELTVHGFRSTFRDWCAEMTSYPRELAESALAHTLKDQTEAAYQRGDMLEKRRKLMEAWSDYCLNGKQSGDVIPTKYSQRN